MKKTYHDLYALALYGACVPASAATQPSAPAEPAKPA
jgi:hypothetical protein